MATIELSPGFVAGASGFVSRLAGLNTQGFDIGSGDVRAQASFCGILSDRTEYVYGTTGIAQLHIMKGAVPTDFSALTSFTVRSADVLVSFTTLVSGVANPPTAQDFGPSVATANPLTVNTNYVAATASGTATWFWWVVRGKTLTGTAVGNSLIHQIIGTVGTPGSGADLEIPTVDVVAGIAYRVMNMRLQFPTVWNY